jgi:exo-beta-1,3-glucanase (GH17 family)
VNYIPGAARAYARIARMFVPVGKLSSIAAAVILLAEGGAAPATTPFCGTNPAATARMTRLREAMAHGRFVAYQPTSLQVVNGVSSEADPLSIRADLEVLRPRFDSLITYGSIHGARAIPAIAASLGFRAIIVGVWNPFSPPELDAALQAAARNEIVVGVSLGNELLFFHRHSATDLAALLDEVHRRMPQLPVSTTEPFQMFDQAELTPVLRRLDFLLANVHPIFQPWFHTAPPDNAVQFVVNVSSALGRDFCGPILVKETGIPSAPDAKGFTLLKQAAFYGELQRRLPSSRNLAWAYFAAFDAPWRLHDVGAAPEEAHWGLYDERRQPKPVVASIKPLDPSGR